MNEREWLDSVVGFDLLCFARDRDYSKRRLWLAACAICRLVGMFGIGAPPAVLASVEDFIEERIGSSELEAIHWDMRARWGRNPDNRTLYIMAMLSEEGQIPGAVPGIMENVLDLMGARGSDVSKGMDVRQAQVVREVIGNPFRPTKIASVWRTPTVISLAQAAYDERILPSGQLDVSRLAVLADALEEAGCTEASLLEHLRSLGPHVRGCWALDLVLGKK